MNQIGNEHAIIMVKPDGYKKKVAAKIKQYFVGLGLEIVKERTFNLVNHQIEESFTSRHNIQELTQYLTSGPVTALLVRGVNAYEIVRIHKVYLREKFGVSNNIKNILHSPEAGNEYDKQLYICFPDITKSGYDQYADLYVKVSIPFNKEQVYQHFNQITDSTNAHCVFVIEENDYIENCELIMWVLHELQGNRGEFGISYKCVFNDHSIELIGYFSTNKERPKPCHGKKIKRYNVIDEIKLIYKSGGIPFLGFSDCHIKDIINALPYYHSFGVSGMIIYHPSYSIFETEQLREACFQVGMNIIGGSGGVAEAGRCGISYEIYKKFKQIVHYKRMDQ